PQLLVAVHPQLGGQLVDAHEPSAHPPVLQPSQPPVGALPGPHPRPHAVQVGRQLSRGRPAHRNPHRLPREALPVLGERPAGVPPTGELALHVGGRRPRRHAGATAWASECAVRRSRYSSIVMHCSRELSPSAVLSTKPTDDTYGSITWIFCSGVTISSCSPSR